MIQNVSRQIGAPSRHRSIGRNPVTHLVPATSCDARTQYIAGAQASNPASPLATLPRRSLVQTEIRSISSLGGDTALIRFSTVRTDPGDQPQPPRLWAAVLKYRFSGAEMSAADRLLNPLGFQVVRYQRDAEIVPEVQQAVSPAPAAMPAQPGQAAQPPGYRRIQP